MLWARVHLHLKLMLCRKHSEHQTTYQIHKVLAENVNTKLFDNRHECQSRLRTLWNTLITFYLLSFRSCTDNRLNAKHIQWILSRSVFRCCFCFTIASSRVLPPTKKTTKKNLFRFLQIDFASFVMLFPCVMLCASLELRSCMYVMSPSSSSSLFSFAFLVHSHSPSPLNFI